PEALMLSVLLADAGVSNALMGAFEPLHTRVFSSNPVDHARRLLGLHVDARRVTVLNGLESLQSLAVKNVVLTSHMRGPESIAAQERWLRLVSKNLTEETNVIVTGLCRPGYCASVGALVEKMAGLSPNLCYVPLLWEGEGLQVFRETPRILACSI